MKSSKKQVPQISFHDQLESRVIFNQSITVEEETQTYIRLRIQLQLTGFTKLYAKIFPIRNYHKYILSDFSLELFRIIREKPYRLIDLIYYLRDLEKLSFFEARVLILQYVGDLMRRGIVVVELPSADDPDENSEEDSE